MVNYAAFNEEEIKAAPQPAPTPIEKLWEEIIPADEREKAQAKKIEEMELKPRSRKTVEKVKPLFCFLRLQTNFANMLRGLSILLTFFHLDGSFDDNFEKSKIKGIC